MALSAAGSLPSLDRGTEEIISHLPRAPHDSSSSGPAASTSACAVTAMQPVIVDGDNTLKDPWHDELGYGHYVVLEGKEVLVPRSDGKLISASKTSSSVRPAFASDYMAAFMSVFHPGPLSSTPNNNSSSPSTAQHEQRYSNSLAPPRKPGRPKRTAGKRRRRRLCDVGDSSVDEDEDDDHEDDEAWTPSVCPRQGLRPRSAGSGQQANGFVRRSGRRIQHDSLGDIPLDEDIGVGLDDNDDQKRAWKTQRKGTEKIEGSRLCNGTVLFHVRRSTGNLEWLREYEIDEKLVNVFLASTIPEKSV